MCPEKVKSTFIYQTAYCQKKNNQKACRCQLYQLFCGKISRDLRRCGWGYVRELNVIFKISSMRSEKKYVIQNKNRIFAL